MRVFSSNDQAAFMKFHFANPEVEDKLARMALDLMDSGVKGWSLWPLYGTLRYTHMLSEQTDSYKMANGHIAYFARLIMWDYWRLDGFFTIRGRVKLPPNTSSGGVIIAHKLTLERWCRQNNFHFPG